MSIIAELERLNLSALSKDERWALLQVAEKAASYVVTHRDAISSPRDAKVLVHSQLARLKHEVFLAVFLDVQNRVLACEKMFQGTISFCSVHPREIVKRALELNAAALIVAHNHPSGHPEPSKADRDITMRLFDALALIDVSLLDHLVVGAGCGDNFVSMAERGWCIASPK